MNWIIDVIAIIGGILISAGVFLLLGLPHALIAAGILLILLSLRAAKVQEINVIDSE